VIKRNDYWYWNKEIPHEICQKIINLGKGKWSQAITLYGRSVDGVRKSDVVWINEQWVYDLIFPYMMDANEQAGWKYNIIGVEDCQITRYTKDGFYTWHKDGIGSHNEVHNKPDSEFLHGNARKLSMSIILNSDYEGGDFETSESDDENKVPSSKEGSIIVFPSFMDHRVTPVTKGTRYSLVAWFVGPPFV
jgi:PKHD-type hydroxylase